MEDDGERHSLPLAAERATVAKRTVETGGLRVRVVTERHQEPLQAELRTESVSLERVEVGRELRPDEAPPQPRQEEGGALLVVPVLEEVLVVEKRLVLREELRIRRHATTETVKTSVTIRRQRAEIEHLPPEPRPND